MVRSDELKARALEIGFDLCGVAPAEGFPELRLLREWLDLGYAGTMGYLPRTARVREDVRNVIPSARAVVVLGTLYHTDRPLSVESSDAAEAIVSRYAWGDDYHDVVGARMEALLGWMRQQHPEPFEARAYVDTGPVQERVYAQYAGLGWVGKNACLINRDLGSWLFLSEIVCSLPLQPDAPALDQCGTCSLCLEACPTGALAGPRLLDATRCLSYLTIELKSSMPEGLREHLGRRIYGCDICQDVCPWNMRAPASTAAEWQPRAGLDSPRLVELWRRSDEEWKSLTQGSAMTRAKLTGLRRNVAVAMGNSGDDEAFEALDEAGAEPSVQDPMVREHVEWARRQKG